MLNNLSICRIIANFAYIISLSYVESWIFAKHFNVSTDSFATNASFILKI